MDLRWRFLVVGAGPAGSATAITLAASGHHVTLVESSGFDTPRVGELLSPEGQTVIRSLLSEYEPDCFLTKIGVVGAWHEPALHRFAGPSWWTVDRLALDLALAKRAESQGAELHLRSKVKNLQGGSNGWSYDLNGEERHADWVILATGRNGQLNRAVKARTERFDRQVALVGFLNNTQAATQDMLIETTKLGWWYAAPVDESSSVAVFITDSDLDEGDASTAWQDRMAESCFVRQRFGSESLQSKPFRVAAGFSLLVPSYGERWAAVGEASASFDPLSNLGLGRAAETGVRLGETFCEAAELGVEPNLLIYSEKIGAEFKFHSQILFDDYRKVDHFPKSDFWSRRVSNTHNDNPLRIKFHSPAPTKLVFAKDQRLEYTPGEASELSGHFPFIFRQTPDGLVVGVSFLSDSVKENRGKPLESYEKEIRELLAVRPVTVLPHQILVSWGRGVDWSEGSALESYLLSDDLIERTRKARWYLIDWLNHPSGTTFNYDGPSPRAWLIELEKQMALYLIAKLEIADFHTHHDLHSDLGENRSVHLWRSEWHGRAFDMMERLRVDRLDWVNREIERFLRALIERKFLILRSPLYHNLLTLSALPRLLRFYTALNADKRKGETIERDDYYKALDLVEMTLTAHGRQDQAAQTFFYWHQSLYDHEKRSGTIA